MRQPNLFHMEMARDWCIEVAESCPNEMATVQLELFNNTIQWHVGHILIVAERMLNYSNQPTFLPPTFKDWFESGTRPSNWNEHPPDIGDLVQLLKDQRAWLHDVTPLNLDTRLDQPLYGFTTFRECADFVALHEALHVGKIEEMMRVIQHKLAN